MTHLNGGVIDCNVEETLITKAKNRIILDRKPINPHQEMIRKPLTKQLPDFQSEQILILKQHPFE